MSERLRALTSVIAKPHGFSAAIGEEVIEVSAPVSTAAVLYERIRNTLEYQEEHLLRRNAIARFLQRHMGEGTALANFASDLLRELVWAKYLPNKAVPTHLAETLAAVIAKYEILLKAAEQGGEHREQLSRWVLDAMATEVEYTVAPPHHDEAITSYMYQEMRERVDWDVAFGVSEEERDLRLFIAVHRALLKSNIATLRYRVLTLYYPQWSGPSTPALAEDIAANLAAITTKVDAEISHPVVERLTRLLRRRAGVFRVLRDIIEHDTHHFPELIEEPDALDREVGHALHERTQLFRTRLRRTVIRAIIFLFITKMLLALVLEVPYDLLFAHDTPRYPLLINIFFPPFFLALLSLTISIPEKRNEDDYRAAIRALIVNADHPILNFRFKREVHSAWTTIFNFVYAATFLLVFGVIGMFLHRIGFHALSITLFIFFLSLVTFFGIRIRNSTKDIIASEARSGIIGTAFDVFMLPIVRAGSWLSVKVAKINIFIFFFDFMIEAPFKVAIRFVESWLAFVREKKEEI